MKKKVLFFAVLLVLYVSPRFNVQAQSSKVDLEKVAADLVNQCAGVTEGEIVMVSGGAQDLELLENIAVNVRKKGAFPLLTVSSDRLTRKMFTEVPVKYDSQEPKLGMHMVKFITTQISVPSGLTSGLLADIPPERFVTRGEASKPVQEYVEKNPIKSVALGNGMYPTQANADEFGISLKQLSDIFWAGINVDYTKLAADGKKLSGILEQGKILEITNKNGTDFSVEITSRPSYCSDGVIDKEDMKKGIAGYSVYLPAGEVYLAPVKGTANGTIVVDNFPFRGNTIENLVLEFKGGKLISMNANSGLKAFKESYDAQNNGIEEFSVVDFGINPNVKIPKGSKFVSWMPAGMVTVGIGNNSWAGGDNDASSGYSFFLPGCDVKIDGKALVDKGTLKL